jgi:DNA-directed RNA polymerase subunit RPC12/RpoP
VEKVKQAVKIHSEQFPAFPWHDSSGTDIFWAAKMFRNKARIALAQNLEKCGRTPDAAKIFEDLRMYDKARELREKEKHILIRKTDISINLNALLNQVRDGGIVVVYRCPHCGGALKIGKDTNVEALKTCQHCGSEIQAMDLADFLRTALS